MKKNTQLILGVLGLLFLVIVLANNGKREGNTNMSGARCTYPHATPYVNAIDDALLHHGSEHSSLKRRGLCGTLSLDSDHHAKIRARLAANEKAVALTKHVLFEGNNCGTTATAAAPAANAAERAAQARGRHGEAVQDYFEHQGEKEAGYGMGEVLVDEWGTRHEKPVLVNYKDVEVGERALTPTGYGLGDGVLATAAEQGMLTPVWGGDGGKMASQALIKGRGALTPTGY